MIQRIMTSAVLHPMMRVKNVNQLQLVLNCPFYTTFPSLLRTSNQDFLEIHPTSKVEKYNFEKGDFQINGIITKLKVTTHSSRGI